MTAKDCSGIACDQGRQPGQCTCGRLCPRQGNSDGSDPHAAAAQINTGGMDELKTLSYWMAIAGILFGFFAGLLLGYRLAKTLMP